MENVEIIRSKRRTLAIEITRDARVLVRAPLRVSKREIERFLSEKQPWIADHLSLVRERLSSAEPPFTAEELEALVQAAKDDIYERVERYRTLLGVSVGRVTIRCQRTKWGSCSAKGNLNFNCLLMLCPPEVRDFVVVHELCHRKELNHSARFWKLVESVMPDYRERQSWMREHEHAFFARLR